VILHEPELTRRDGRIRVESRIETRHSRLADLDRLWFEVDETSGLAISDRADSFLVGMIPIAMACRAKLEVRGSVSPRLAWGIEQLQRIHFAWWPRHVRVVEVRCERMEEAPSDQRGSGVASSFSGGVDSLYTVWRHTGERESIPGFGLDYALLINGFDLDLDLESTGRWRVLREVYGQLLAPLGVELISVRTNLQTFRVAGVGRGGHIRSFGNALVAAALALSPALGRFYLAAAHGYGVFHPDGSTPSTDHLLSTAGFQSIHDGADVPTRFAKVAALTAWPEAVARLRVCSNRSWRNVDVGRGAIDNCGRCRKCVWTLISLELLTGQTRFPSFPRTPTRADLRYAARRNPHRAGETLSEALARGRRDIAFAVRCGRAQRALERLFRPVLPSRAQRRTRSRQTAFAADQPRP
jgi:hypothetical protein